MGKYSVPENIRKMKPVGTTVKFIHNKYYVYEIHSKKYPSGHWGCKTGKLVGYIDERDGFIANDSSIVSQEVSTLEYGQYAIAINNSLNVLNRLLLYFNKEDAYTIFLLAIIHVVNSFKPLKDIHKYVEQSYISIKYPNIKFKYHNLVKLLDALGRRQGKVVSFEQSLIDDCSKEIAIDGHSIKNVSNINNLADKGNKFLSFGDTQLNVLMAYDVVKDMPLASRIYPGSVVDKKSVQDLLSSNNYQDVLFIVDKGFYTKENIDLFSQNNNHYMIPLLSNTKEYKDLTESMVFQEMFVYEKNKKITLIEYKEMKIDENTKVIIYRDMTENAKEKANYLKNIELKPEKYTYEKYNEIESFFGVITIQTNLDNDAKTIYEYYKKRWKIETYFDYFKNRVDINALGINDYYVTQGMSFIMLIIGLIHKELTEATKVIKGKSLDDCLLDARFIKLNKKSNTWYVSNAKTSLQEMMGKLNINLSKPLD